MEVKPYCMEVKPYFDLDAIASDFIAAYEDVIKSKNLGENMIQLDPGTILKKDYKGNEIKVKVLKDGAFAFNGKTYEDRKSLMKAILKGKTGQFTTFFGLGKNGESKATTDDTPEDTHDRVNGSTENMTLESIIRSIVRDEIRKAITIS